jgi:hypothetical protein
VSPIQSSPVSPPPRSPDPEHRCSGLTPVGPFSRRLLPVTSVVGQVVAPPLAQLRPPSMPRTASNSDDDVYGEGVRSLPLGVCLASLHCIVKSQLARLLSTVGWSPRYVSMSSSKLFGASCKILLSSYPMLILLNNKIINYLSLSA